MLEAELAQNGGRLGFRSVGDDARQLVQQCRAPQSSYLLDERATVLVGGRHALRAHYVLAIVFA